MIEASSISKSFVEKKFLTKNTEKKVLKNINLKLHQGEIVGLLGVNGAGKTTIIKILSSLLLPTSGTVFIKGKPLENNLKEYRKKINIIAGGEQNLYLRLSSYDNLMYFGKLYSISNKVLNERVDELLKIVGLFGNKNVPVENLSKGMKQRLQIAKGLINDPEYLFLDEPTIGLDVSILIDIHNLLLKIVREKNVGILLTTHYMRDVEVLCNRVYLIDKGENVLEGTIEDIKSKLNVKKRIEVLFFTESIEIITQKLGSYFKISKIKKKGDQFSVNIFSEDFVGITNLLSSLNVKNLEVKVNEGTLEEAILMFERNR